MNQIYLQDFINSSAPVISIQGAYKLVISQLYWKSIQTNFHSLVQATSYKIYLSELFISTFNQWRSAFYLNSYYLNVEKIQQQQETACIYQYINHLVDDKYFDEYYDEEILPQYLIGDCYTESGCSTDIEVCKQDLSNKNETFIASKTVEQNFTSINIQYDDKTFPVGQKYYPIIIKDIYLKNTRFLSPFLQISNQQNQVQKIIVENITIEDSSLDTYAFYKSLLKNSLFFDVNSNSSYIFIKNFSLINVFQVYNLTSIDQQTIFTSSSQTSLIQAQCTILYSQQISYSLNMSQYKQQLGKQQLYFLFLFQITNTEIQAQDTHVEFGRFADFIGFQIYVKDSYFENIKSQSGGVVRFSPSSTIGKNLIQFQNVTAKNIFVYTVGGILQVYTAYLGQDVKVNIYDCNFHMINANYSGGIVYIENLGKSINMNIYKTTLDTISAFQTTILELHDQAQHSLMLQDVLITEGNANSNSLYQSYNKNSLFLINNANTIFYNTTILNIKGAIMLIQSTQSKLRISNSQITQNDVYMQILNVQNGFLEVDSTTISFNNLMFAYVDIPNDSRFKDIYINCQSPISCSSCNQAIFLDSMIISNQIFGCSDSYMSFERSVTLFKRCQIYNNTVPSIARDMEYPISVIKFFQKAQSSNCQINLILHSDINLNILTKDSKGVVQVLSTQLLVFNSTFSSNNAGYGGSIYYGYQTSQTNSYSGSRMLMQSKAKFENEYKFRSLDEQKQNMLDYESYYLGQITNQVAYEQRDINYYQQVNLQYPGESQLINDQMVINQYNQIFKYQNTSEVFIVDLSKFENNYATYSGGAIHYVSCQEVQKCKFVLYNSNFINNSAGINSPAVSSLNHVPTFKNNTAELNHLKNGQNINYDVASFNIAPTLVKINFLEKNDINYLKIQSGEVQDEGLVVELYNFLNEKIFYSEIDSLPTCQLYFADTKMVADFNITTNSLVFTPFQLTYEPGKQKQLGIQCSCLKVPYIDGSGVVENQNYMTYEKNILVEFDKCNQGDIYLFDKQICSKCNKGSYTFDNPEKAICQVCPMGAYCAGGNKIQLLKGYWNNQNNKPQTVIECYQNINNCVGEVDSNGTTLPETPFTPCDIGHVGALCEQCDIRSAKSSKRYFSNGNYECGDCDSPEKIYTKISFVLLGCFIFAIITVNAIVSEVKNKILKAAFKLMGVLLLGTNSQYFQASSSLFKIFINYAQINFIIYTLKLNNPGIITEVIQSIISPFKFLETGFDCALSYTFNLDIIYVKVFGYCLLPIFYYVVIVFFLCIIEIFHKKIIKNYYFYISAFFVTLFTIPSVVQYLVLVLSCRQIGNQKYITADVTQTCYTAQHVEYIKKLLIPSIVVYVFLVPSAMITFLYFNKHKLQNNIFELKFGFLYREYKAIVFYWEIIRLVIKVIIYSVISIWDENVQAKALFSILMLIIYQYALNKTQPFKNDRLNFLESLSTSLNIFSIFIALFCKIADRLFFVYLGFVLVIGLNIIFLTYLGVDFYKIYKNGFNKLGRLMSKCLRRKTQTQEIQREENIEKELTQSQIIAIQKWFHLKTFVLVYIQLKKIRIPVQIYSEEVFFIYNKIKKVIPLMSLDQIQKEMANKIDENMKLNGFYVLKIENNSSSFINKLIEQNAQNLISFNLSDHLSNLKNFYDLQNVHEGRIKNIFEGNTIVGKEITLNEDHQQIRLRNSSTKSKTNAYDNDSNLFIQQNQNLYNQQMQALEYAKEIIPQDEQLHQNKSQIIKQRTAIDDDTNSKGSQELILQNKGNFMKQKSQEEEEENSHKVIELSEFQSNSQSDSNKKTIYQQTLISPTNSMHSNICLNQNLKQHTSPVFNSGHALTEKFKNHKTDPQQQEAPKQVFSKRSLSQNKEWSSLVNQQNLEEVIHFESDDDEDDINL